MSHEKNANHEESSPPLSFGEKVRAEQAALEAFNAAFVAVENNAAARNINFQENFQEKMAELAVLGRDLTVEQIERERFMERFDKINGFAGVRGYSAGTDAGRPLLAAWSKSGVLFKTGYFVSGQCAEGWLAHAGSARWVTEWAENPHWMEASCDDQYSEDGIGFALAKLRPWAGEEFDPRLHAPWNVNGFRINVAENAMLLEFLKRSEAAGRLEQLKKSHRAAVWLMQCIRSAPLERVEAIVAAGVNLKDVGQAEAQRFFFSMIGGDQPYERMQLAYESGGEVKKKADRDAIEAQRAIDAERLLKVWKIAIDAGLPRIDLASVDKHMLAHAVRSVRNDATMAILAQEVAREGGFNKPLSLLWIASSAMGPWHPNVSHAAGAKHWESSMDWSVKNGLPLRGWTHEELTNCLKGRPLRHDNPLFFMAKAGLKLDLEREELDADNTGLVASLMRGDMQRGFDAGKALAQIDANFEWRMPNGGGLLEHFLESAAPKGIQTALLVAEFAEKKAPGLAKTLVAMKNGSGASAIHWAARALSVDALELCLAHGADINARDNEGQTALHWAARKYGKKAQEKLAGVVQWLKNHGLDTTAVDSAGVTGVAALAKKGPIDAVMKILESAPETADQKSSAGVSAIDHLRNRGGHGLAVAETLLLDAELKKLSAKNKETTAPGSSAVEGADGERSADSSKSASGKPRRAARRM